MKKFFIPMVCMLAAIVSCQKNDVAEKNPEAIQPVMVTLRATIGDDDTKVSYVEEANVLKTAWELYDKVSVLSLDDGGNVLYNDIFTSQSAGKTADFSGYFHNDPLTASVWVYYPALTEGEGTEEKPWQVPSANSLDTFGVLSDVKVNHEFSANMDFTSGHQLQKESNKFSNLEQFIVMSGQADLEKLSSSELDVKIYHRSYVIKMDITLPKAGLTVRSLTVSAKSSDGTKEIPLSGTGWVGIDEPELFPGGWDTSWIIYFGDDMSALPKSGTGIKLDDTTLTAYVVAYAGQSYNYDAGETRYYRLTEGDYLTFTADITDNGDDYDCVLDRKDIAKTTIFENGKMYRLSAELVAKQYLWIEKPNYIITNALYKIACGRCRRRFIIIY